MKFGGKVQIEMQSKREVAYFAPIGVAVFEWLATSCKSDSAGLDCSKSLPALVTTATLPLVGLPNFGAGRHTFFDRPRRLGFAQAALCV